jgi:iron complex transport system substrate-binding protein
MIHDAAGRAMLRAALLAAALAAAQAAAADIRLRDDRGVELALGQPAARIVTLAPYLTELAFAAGAGAKLVGVSAFSDFPPEARALPQISDSAHVDFEALARLTPDLVLAWRSGNRPRDIAQLEARRLRVFVTEPGGLEDVPRLVRTIGTLAGTAAEAEARAAAMEARFAALRARYARVRELRVFYEIWHEPLMTVNGQHYVSAMLALCGGRNVFAAAAPLTPVISREQLLAADPDVVLVSTVPSRAEEAIAAWRRWETLRAVQRGALYVIDAAVSSRMGSRVVEGAEAICATLDRAR